MSIKKNSSFRIPLDLLIKFKQTADTQENLTASDILVRGLENILKEIEEKNFQLPPQENKRKGEQTAVANFRCSEELIKRWKDCSKANGCTDSHIGRYAVIEILKIIESKKK